MFFINYLKIIPFSRREAVKPPPLGSFFSGFFSGDPGNMASARSDGSFPGGVEDGWCSYLPSAPFSIGPQKISNSPEYPYGIPNGSVFAFSVIPQILFRLFSHPIKFSSEDSRLSNYRYFVSLGNHYVAVDHAGLFFSDLVPGGLGMRFILPINDSSVLFSSPDTSDVFFCSNSTSPLPLGEVSVSSDIKAFFSSNPVDNLVVFLGGFLSSCLVNKESSQLFLWDSDGFSGPFSFSNVVLESFYVFGDFRFFVFSSLNSSESSSLPSFSSKPNADFFVSYFLSDTSKRFSFSESRECFQFFSLEVFLKDDLTSLSGHSWISDPSLFPSGFTVSGIEVFSISSLFEEGESEEFEFSIPKKSSSIGSFDNNLESVFFGKHDDFFDVPDLACSRVLNLNDDYFFWGLVDSSIAIFMRKTDSNKKECVGVVICL